MLKCFKVKLLIENGISLINKNKFWLEVYFVIFMFILLKELYLKLLVEI